MMQYSSHVSHGSVHGKEVYTLVSSQTFVLSFVLVWGVIAYIAIFQHITTYLHGEKTPTI